MAERRSLVSGIEEIGVDPEVARAFIVEPTAKPKSSPVRVVPNVADIATSPQAEAAEVETNDDGRGEKNSAPATQKKASKPVAQNRSHAQRMLATLLVPVTVRLRPEIASALKQASLQRQLHGIATYTQQDIVEEALLPWLQAEGILD